MKNNISVLLLSVMAAACVNQPVDKPAQRKLMQQSEQPPYRSNNKALPLPQNSQALPLTYMKWLNEADHAFQVQAYHLFLVQKGVASLIPQHEFLHSAKDWQTCGFAEFEVPPQALWPNIVPTLQIVQQLLKQHVIRDYTVTSVYRNFNLNRCAKGAASSRHVLNAALDFRIGSEFPDAVELQTIEKTKQRLCQFWQDQGAAYNMGLGVYSSGQIHVDSAGYRTWGPDHKSTSSPCSVKPAPSFLNIQTNTADRIEVNTY